MQLSVIQLDPKKYTVLDMYTLEQFYIDHLNSQFNAVKVVYFSRKKSEKTIADLSALPSGTDLRVKVNHKMNNSLEYLYQRVYIYDQYKSKLLYIANSATHAKLILETGSDSIRKSILEKKLFLNYFYLSLELLPNSVIDKKLSREELINLKNSLKVNYIPEAISDRKKSVILINVNLPDLSKTVDSLAEAERYINSIKGYNYCTRAGLRYCINKNSLFKKE